MEQNLDLQIDALEKAGCTKIITDKISGLIADSTVQEVCRMMGISKPTLYQYLQETDGKST